MHCCQSGQVINVSGSDDSTSKADNAAHNQRIDGVGRVEAVLSQNMASHPSCADVGGNRPASALDDAVYGNVLATASITLGKDWGWDPDRKILVVSHFQRRLDASRRGWA